MFKKILIVCLCVNVAMKMHAAQPQAHQRHNPAINAHLKISDLPNLPIEVKLNVEPSLLVSGIGFTSCIAAIQLYKEGSALLASHDSNELIQKAKHDEGRELIKKSYILFLAGSLAIFNKQILQILTKQG